MEVAMFCLCVTTTIVSVERSTLFPAQRFAAFQALPTTGATCVAPFALGGARGGASLLAVANFFDGSFHAVDSEVGPSCP